MIDKDKVKRGPPKHDATCYRLERDIVIPAGTILRPYVGNTFGCGADFGEFSVYREEADLKPDIYRKVISA